MGIFDFNFMTSHTVLFALKQVLLTIKFVGAAMSKHPKDTKNALTNKTCCLSLFIKIFFISDKMLINYL